MSKEADNICLTLTGIHAARNYELNWCGVRVKDFNNNWDKTTCISCLEEGKKAGRYPAKEKLRELRRNGKG